MSKIALITDTHYGIRGDNQVFYEYFKLFYSEIFFPYIDEHKIDTVIHLGDVVDRRKYINYLTSRKLDEQLMQPMFDRGLDVHVLLGNHDVAYKDTNEINSMKELYGNSKYSNLLTIYEGPKTVNIKGLDIAMIPWICDGNYKETMQLINDTKAQVAMGHLELAGFELYRGHIQDHGMSRNIFDKFDLVFSGHYHHKSSHGNIHYLGATCQHTWSDFDDPRGFHIFDTETRTLEFIENPFEIFRKFYYDDTGKKVDEMLDTVNGPLYTNTYTKIIVKNKSNPYLFDMVISKIEKSGVTDLQIVEDALNLESIADDYIGDEAQDTVTILKKYIDGLDTKVMKGELETFMLQLYNEAINIER